MLAAQDANGRNNQDWKSPTMLSTAGAGCGAQLSICLYGVRHVSRLTSLVIEVAIRVFGYAPFFPLFMKECTQEHFKNHRYCQTAQVILKDEIDDMVYQTGMFALIGSAVGLLFSYYLSRQR